MFIECVNYCLILIFFKLLEAGSLELTRKELKEINRGDSLFQSDFAYASAYCSKSGKTVSYAGTNYTGKDDVGCSCDNGADSKACDKE